jgi:hypothetical protein
MAMHMVVYPEFGGVIIVAASSWILNIVQFMAIGYQRNKLGIEVLFLQI